MSKAILFSIVIPCYNEELAIPKFLEELALFKAVVAEKFPHVKTSFIFVNNNSRDNSKLLLEKYCLAEKDVQVVDCFEQGYGAALKYGFSKTTSNYYGFLDLDNTYPLETFFQGLSSVLSDDAIDMIMTNRFSKVSKMPAVRSFGNQFFAKLVQWLFQHPISDACSGMRIIHSRRIRDVIQLSCDGLDFSIQLTCTAIVRKWNIHYQDMIYNQRDGESKLSIVKDGLLFLKAVLKTRFL